MLSWGAVHGLGQDVASSARELDLDFIAGANQAPQCSDLLVLEGSISAYQKLTGSSRHTLRDTA